MFLFTVWEFSVSEENAHLAQGMCLAKYRSACPNEFKLDIYLRLIIALTINTNRWEKQFALTYCSSAHLLCEAATCLIYFFL